MIGIDPNKSISPQVNQQKVENQQKTSTQEFQNVFQKAIGSVETEASSIEPTPFISEIHPVQFETQAMPSTKTIVDQVSRLINVMETYQQQLMDRNQALKDIEPTIEEIIKQSKSLSAISRNRGMEDDLKSIVNQSLSLASQEMARYRSGHYNDD